MKAVRKYWSVTPMLSVLCVALVLLLIPSFFLNRYWFYVQATITAILLVVTMVRSRRLKRDVQRYLATVANGLDPNDQQSLEITPIPVLAISADREVVWYNALFRSEVLDGGDAYGETVEEILDGIGAEQLGRRFLPCVTRGEKTFAVYNVKVRRHDAAYLLYFAENTELTEIATEYENSRPIVLSLYIDNSEEITQKLRDSERAQLISRVESLLEDWVASFSGVFRKCGTDRFLAIGEQRYLNGMLENRFDILDRVRAIRTADGASVTLSIGVGVGTSLTEAEKYSRLSLDMALGRGGDQAAMKTPNGFDFYGGLSKSVEKRTKVRTRVMASALLNIINNGENVLLMGHRFSDLDCLGSCAALTEVCRSLGKTAYTVYDPKTTLANVLVRRYEAAGQDDLFIEEEDALPLINDNTVLIITDIHQPNRLDIPDVYAKAKTVVVIDHHRKMVEHITDAALFYHEPYSSSASEMVAELIQYMPDVSISAVGAEALLGGIMLDTRSFVMKAGVRTFEAAAYLRRLGADTVKVKQLFSETMDTYQLKAEIVAAAERYDVTAIACAEEPGGTQLRIAASQAADELLCVKGVDASFVLFSDGNGYSISARSYGTVNVQLVMEAIGGGGHQTMAGAYLKTNDKQTAIDQLKGALDRCLEEQKRAKTIENQSK